MLEAFLWGALAASTLLLGALIAVWRPPSTKVVGAVMAFGSGVLLSAVAYELIAKAVVTNHGLRGATLGFAVGTAVFTAGDWLLSRGSDGEGGSGLTITLGALLDGIPESAVLGLTILQTGEVGVAMLVAVFISNLPEGIAATVGLRASGWSTSKALWLWIGVVVASALSAALGYGLLDHASDYLLAFVLAFAAGAILTMLATSMIPEAYEAVGRAAGVLTVVGFAVALAVNWLDG